jgi:predicted aspartyl protease
VTATVRRASGLALALLTGFAQAAVATAPALPVLHAHTRTLDVREGRRFERGAWEAQPGLALDVYRARRSDRSRTITFYSDRESLAFAVEPGREYDFVVLLDDSIACPTRISTMRTNARHTGLAGVPVEIPFSVGRNHRLHVLGRVNGSAPLRLMFDTGAATTVLFPSAFRKGVRLGFEGTTENAGSGGTVTRRTSDDDTLEIAGLTWTHSSVLYVEKQAGDSDGIIGIDLFEDRVLELDHARRRMIVHDSLPALEAGTRRLDLRWRGSLPLVPVTLDTGTRRFEVPLVLNTGSSGALTVNGTFAARYGLPGSLERQGTARVSGVGPKSARADRVILPALVIGGVELRGVPSVVGRPSPGGDLFGDMVGMQILERFRTVLDLRDDALYLEPVPGADRPFPRRSGFPWMVPALALATILMGTVLLVVRNRAGRPARG